MRKPKDIVWYIGSDSNPNARLIFNADDNVDLKSWMKLREFINKTIKYKIEKRLRSSK